MFPSLSAQRAIQRQVPRATCGGSVPRRLGETTPETTLANGVGTIGIVRTTSETVRSTKPYEAMAARFPSTPASNVSKLFTKDAIPSSSS